MRNVSPKVLFRFSLLLMFILVIPAGRLAAQNQIGFGLFADPVISWFSTDTKETRNVGARPGFNFGLTYNKYFANNYAFSTGISILSTGGTLKDTSRVIYLKNTTKAVTASEPVTYRIQFLNFPVGLKFKSNQIGYYTFFSDIGLDPKIVIAGNFDIRSLGYKKEGALNELNRFNLGYHIMAGVEYSLGGSTAVVLGLGFENDFLDITKDNKGQTADKVTMKLIRFRIGVNF
jgi:hypothetical protein